MIRSLPSLCSKGKRPQCFFNILPTAHEEYLKMGFIKIMLIILSCGQNFFGWEVEKKCAWVSDKIRDVLFTLFKGIVLDFPTQLGKNSKVLVWILDNKLIFINWKHLVSIKFTNKYVVSSSVNSLLCTYYFIVVGNYLRNHNKQTEFEK